MRTTERPKNAKFAHLVKNFLYFFCIACVATSCASMRSGTSASAVKHKPRTSSTEQPRFLENISIRPGGPGIAEDETAINAPAKVNARKDVPGSVYSTDIERSHALQFKYAILMEKEVESVTNAKLINFLEEWYGTPYQFGGDSKKGVDCSAFSCAMMSDVYNISLPRTAREQYKEGVRVSKSDLKQGDLVFFNTSGGISHVGVFLGNQKFVHASTSSGVMISDLDEAYFKRRYVGATRIR